MFGDDRVIRYTGADDDTGDAEDAQATEWGLVGIRAKKNFLLYFIYGFWILEIQMFSPTTFYKFWRDV